MKRLGLGVLLLGVEVGRQVVVTVGGVGRGIRRLQAAVISSAFSYSGWAWAYFPWALSVCARFL